jgi:2-oxoglutarate ferredoxin oxidoreductase subunit beta
MDNAVYGLTKGQSSPTSELGMVTSSTPYGKTEAPINALRMYLTYGVSFVASAMSSKINDLADLMVQGMEHPGFSIVHVQSPCTEYNDTYEELKGSKRKGIEPKAWAIDEDHDPADLSAAHEIVNKGGVPLGVIYQNEDDTPFEDRMRELHGRAKPKTVAQMVDSFAL